MINTEFRVWPFELELSAAAQAETENALRAYIPTLPDRSSVRVELESAACAIRAHLQHVAEAAEDWLNEA